MKDQYGHSRHVSELCREFYLIRLSEHEEKIEALRAERDRLASRLEQEQEDLRIATEIVGKLQDDRDALRELLSAVCARQGEGDFESGWGPDSRYEWVGRMQKLLDATVAKLGLKQEETPNETRHQQT